MMTRLTNDMVTGQVPRAWVRLGWIVSLVSVWLSASMAGGKTLYVVPPGTPGVTPTPPYTNGWACAATNLTVLRNNMAANDVLIISNGVYRLGAQINPMCPGALIQGLTTNPADVLITPAPGYNGTLFYHDNGGWGEKTTWVGLTFFNAGSRAVQLYYATNVTYRNCVFADNRVAGEGAAVNGAYSADGLQLIDCVFRNNRATGYSRGGAVFASGVVISNCLFSGNYADGPNGGALQISSSALITSMVYNCVFTNNSLTNGGNYGGAGYNSSPLRMSRCTFVSNYCNNVGGGWYISHSNTLIFDCLFTSNRATDGGGMAIAANALVSNCTFVGNNAGTGGGVDFYVSHGGLVVNCVFSNNTANQGGAVGFYHESAGEVRNCLITDNTAMNSAGGIYLRSVLSPPFPAGTSIYTNRVVSCTITRNFAPTGGGIELVCPPYEVVNSIIYSNAATDAARVDLYNDGPYAYGAFTSYYSCCTSSNLPTGNNITNNPKFVDYAGRDFRLAKGSPCIDAGENLSWMDAAVDLGGIARIQGVRPKVDIGAYEFHYVPAGTVVQVR